MIYIAKIIKEWKNMSNPLAKKIIVISAVMLTIVLGAVVLALATGNTRMPEIDDPNGIFYERLDDEGKVIYSITNKEIYEEIKANDGITQLLMMVDTLLLEDYFASITDEQIENKIKQLTYGTDDDDEIAEIDVETKTDLENDFARSMVLSGYSGNEEEYASLLIARENYAYEILESELTEVEVATAFVSSYFEDIKAINIRFTSKEDAESVLEHFNLVEVDDDLAEFLGFTFKDDEILDSDDKPAEAYFLPEVFYFDEDDNLLNVDEEIIYTLGTNGFYTDEDDNSYSLDNDGNLVDSVPNVVVSNTHIFDTLEDAQEYQDENTVYYYMSKTDPFDDAEDILIKDSSDTLMYTVKADGTVLDASDNDVTSTHGLIFNKEYKTIDEVSTFDEFNTKALNEDEVLSYYVKMYNYVYGEYRFTLPEDATKEEIIALGNKSLKFNFEDVKENSSALATYMFETISMLNEKTYSVVPKAISYANASYYYMTYKLLEPTKDNLAEAVLDLIEQSIVLPTNVVEDFELPTESEYGSKISWTSADKTVISNTGEVTTPEEATIVGMKYTITALGKTRTGTINVNVILTGENSEVTEPNVTFPTLKSMIADDIYEELAAKLVDTKVYGSSGAQNISKKLIALRADMGFKLYDYYLAIDYRKTASDFEAEEKGDKTLVASLDKTLKSEDPVEITADDLHLYALEKNPTIYTLYASQFKEMLYSNFYVEAFGTQRNIKRNSTARMEEMLTAVSSSKQYYAYIKSMYAQYGMSYPYETFSDYVYAQYGTKTELELLEYFIQRELQPYLINDILGQYNVVEEIYDIVEDNYDNYFSLDVTHLLIFIDFDEDGNTDDYKEYVADLSDTEKDDFNTLLAALEIAIDEFEGDFEALVKEYLEASREDETWGVFKQNGILLMTQELNMPDEEEENVTHSLNYSGQYGTKDTYAEEFTDALISLYQEYRLPQNSDLDELLSDLVITEFGVHLILAEQGEDFEQFSAKFTEDDANAIDYSTGAYNNSNKPTLAQMELYATYKFYEMVYDLSNADIEEKFNIVVPKIPASVAEALDFYFEGVLNEFYVLGTINVRMAQLLTNGNFVANDYTDLTNAELMANLKEIEDTYYDAIFSKYLS
jgi:hypothetical protein